MDKNIIAFSENWNGKLENEYLTTIRIHNPRKYFPGKIMEVKFKQISYQVEIQKIVTKKLCDFNEYELALDTGYDQENALALFPKFYPTLNMDTVLWDYILLKKVSHAEVQAKQQDLFSALDQIKHPSLNDRNAVLKRIKDIYSLGKVAFLDTETTGLDGEVIELSILEINGNVLFNELIKPVKNSMDPVAFQTHGIDMESLQEKKYLFSHQDRLLEIFDEYFIIIYNQEFDLKILKNSLKLNALLEEKPSIEVDVDKINSDCLMNLYAIYNGHISDKPYHKTGYKTHKLTEACKQMGIDITSVVAHRALADCWMTKELFVKLAKEK